MLAKTLQIVVVLSFLVANSISVLPPQYTTGASKRKPEQIKANFALLYGDQAYDNSNDNFIRGIPLIPRDLMDEQTDYLTKELKALPSFTKCDKAIREKHQKVYHLGNIRQVKMQIEYGIRFTIIYETVPMPTKAIANYDTRKGTVSIQQIKMDPNSVSYVQDSWN